METDAAQAIEALIRDYSKLVFHTIYGLTGHWQESEDLTQETYLQAFRGIEAARAKAGEQFQAKAWLLKIAVNQVRMMQRRQRTWRFIPFADLQAKLERTEHIREPADEELQSADDLETIIAERDVVARCMQQLPGALRTPLLLSVVAGFSSSEIAHLIDLKEAAVRQRLARARKTFRRLYQEANGEHLFIGETIAPTAKRVARLRSHLLHRPAALAPAVAL